MICIGHDCDLALLTVDDEDFWKDLPCLKAPYSTVTSTALDRAHRTVSLLQFSSTLPNLYDSVTVIG